jgi:3-oxoacyl-[acyl-carrier protein] reductase
MTCSVFDPATSTARRAIVSGGSRGIGAAIAQALARDGCRIVIGYKEQRSAAQALVDRIRKSGADARAVQFDVTSKESVLAALEAVDQAHDPFDIVVNNAAVLRDSLFPSMKHADWNLVLTTVLDGFFHLTQPLVLPMIRKRWGRVINIVSHSGLSGNRGQVNYSAAKGGLIAATKALAKEVAARGVTVNAVCPGLIATDMTAQAHVDHLRSQIGLGRIGSPSEVAESVAFLASDSARYITGHVLKVDGGFFG